MNSFDKLTEWEKERIKDAGSFPKVILLDTCSFCNLRCSMCFHREMKREKGVMPWELFTKIIDEIAETDKNVRVWMIFFGDPFVIKTRKPSIFDMIAYAKDKGLTDVVVNSNGNLMDEKSARSVIESGLDAIYFGIDAFTPETYGKLRVGGDYEKTKNNVLALLRLKKELNSSSPQVFVQFVEMDINSAEKDDFIAFWSNAGATVKIRPKISWAGNIEAPNLVLTEKDRWPCHWGMQTMSITDAGNVVTCAVDLDARFIAGNVEHQSLKEVWNGRLRDLRMYHLSHQWDMLPDICRNCKDWQAAKSDYIKV